MANEASIDDILLCAVDLAYKSGKIHLDYFRTSQIGAELKGSASDVVTKVDRASEETIIKGIKACFPEHSVVAEESGEHRTDSPYEWVIDPLDGTVNYSAGLPYFSVSIGVRHEGRTIVGVVYAPRLDELYTATLGGGAMRNGMPIHVSGKQELCTSLVCTGFPVDKHINPDNNTDNLLSILPLVRDVRRMGSAALDICNVAAGSFDAFWEINLHEWDVCAALLIAQEAGADCNRFRTDRNVSVVVGTPVVKHLIEQRLSKMPRRQ